jgi:hypothetical protein
MCALYRAPTHSSKPEHDPENGNRFSEKIMLKQIDENMIRFYVIASCSHASALTPA